MKEQTEIIIYALGAFVSSFTGSAIFFAFLRGLGSASRMPRMTDD